MRRKIPVIQDKAVIAVITKSNPIGEAGLKAGETLSTVPMTQQERQDMVERLEHSISELMDDAENSHQVNSHITGTTDPDPEYITRLSTNEFFFYTKEPLSLKEFEELQNKIAEKAKTLSPGVQLILGSFAVKTDDNKVMNVTPHISCGTLPEFHYIVKNYTSPIDVRYKIPDGLGDTNTLEVLDKNTPSTSMPQIMVNGIAREFNFNNIIPCKTPGGTSFLTAVDICLDHAKGVAKSNYKALANKNPAILKQPISHVVVSNTLALDEDQCIGSAVMHVDPSYSLKNCKKGIFQQEGISRKLEFGTDFFRILDLVRERVHYFIDYVTNDYAYKITDPSAGRDHQSYTASIENIQFQKPQTTSEFQEFKNKYQVYKGDYLKTQILEDLKKRIEDTSSKKELEDLKNELKNSYEVDVLKTGQGWFTRKFGIKTSSQRALEHMIEQQEDYLSDPKLNLPG